MLNYNHLYYFHVVALEGSVAGAAVRLGVTQPTVSEQIRILERTLGTTLFERASTGVRLTDAGRVAFGQTTQMFRAGERLLENLATDSGTLPALLRVGISNAVSRSPATDFLMPLLGIENCMPAIQAGEGVDLLRDVRSGGLDLVLLEAEPPRSLRRGLSMVVIHKTRLVAVATPTLRPSSTWEELALIHYRVSSALRTDVESFLELHSLRPRIAAEADDPVFHLEAAALGGCVAIVPHSVARDSIQASRLAVIAEVEPTHAAVCALYPDGATVELARRAVQLLVERAVRGHA